jgi:hypothetical protein
MNHASHLSHLLFLPQMTQRSVPLQKFIYQHVVHNLNIEYRTRNIECRRERKKKNEEGKKKNEYPKEVRRRRGTSPAAGVYLPEGRLPSTFGVPCSLFDIPAEVGFFFERSLEKDDVLCALCG